MRINPEDFSPVDCPDNPEFDGWGEVYVYDNHDRAHPRFLSTFSTPNSRSSRTRRASSRPSRSCGASIPTVTAT